MPNRMFKMKRLICEKIQCAGTISITAINTLHNQLIKRPTLCGSQFMDGAHGWLAHCFRTCDEPAHDVREHRTEQNLSTKVRR